MTGPREVARGCGHAGFRVGGQRFTHALTTSSHSFLPPESSRPLPDSQAWSSGKGAQHAPPLPQLGLCGGRRGGEAGSRPGPACCGLRCTPPYPGPWCHCKRHSKTQQLGQNAPPDAHPSSLSGSSYSVSRKALWGCFPICCSISDTCCVPTWNSRALISSYLCPSCLSLDKFPSLCTFSPCHRVDRTVPTSWGSQRTQGSFIHSVSLRARHRVGAH